MFGVHRHVFSWLPWAILLAPVARVRSGPRNFDSDSVDSRDHGRCHVTSDERLQLKAETIRSLANLRRSLETLTDFEGLNLISANAGEQNRLLIRKFRD